MMHDATRKAYERAQELERRAAAGTDNVAYCLRWAAIHRRMADAAVQAGR
jgi:hypothetical protein